MTNKISCHACLRYVSIHIDVELIELLYIKTDKKSKIDEGK